MKNVLTGSKEYKAWLTEIKSKVRNAQLKAAVRVNSEMLSFYWELGASIVAKQALAKWGDGLIGQLSKDPIGRIYGHERFFPYQFNVYKKVVLILQSK